MPAASRFVSLSLIVAIATFVQLSHNSKAAELSPKEKELVQLVRNRIQTNYALVTSIQAKVRSVLVEPKSAQRPQPVTESKPTDEGGTFTTSAGELSWTATIAGLNERYEEIFQAKNEVSRKTIIRRGDLELDYVPPHYANLYPLQPRFVRGSYHDPREAMLISREDSLVSLLTDDRVQSAMLLTAGGKNRVRIDTQAFDDFRVILECAESANFLPTQVYFINDGEHPEYKGIVSYGAAVEYNPQTIGKQTVLFPKQIVRKYAGGKMSRDIEAYMGLDGQTNTLTISDLKLNQALAGDAFRAPVFLKDVRFHCFPEVDLVKVPPELRELATADRREQDESAAKLKRLLQPVEDLVGQPAPALPAEGWVGGKRPDFAGQPYLVHFWAVWCGPCKNDYQALRDMATDGVRIVGMHPAGTKPDEVAAFVKERKFGHATFVSTQPDVPDPNQPRIIAGYPAPLYPHYIVVDADGKVAAHGQLQQMRLKLLELTPQEDAAK